MQDINIDKPIQVTTEDFIKAFFGNSGRLYCRGFYEREDKDTADKIPATYDAPISSYSSLHKELKRLNEDGYGIFFVVNGHGQEDKEVKKAGIATAQFMECDNGTFEEQIKKIKAFPLEPSIIIKTSKSLHTYWLLKDGDIMRFRPLQERLAVHFGGDIKVKNESRVMRLPNYYHNKHKPVMVECLKFSPEIRYTQDELDKVLPQTKTQPEKKTATPTAAEYENIVDKYGGRHNALMHIGGIIRQTDITDNELEKALRVLNASFDEPLEEAEINRYIRDLIDYRDEEKTEEITPEEYAQTNALGRFTELEEEIAHSATEQAISTGFYALDNLIDDGIRRGLYILGAVSSLGKTTFLLQIADYAAKQGKDVIFVSLEMSTTELMAKSISRESLDISLMLTQDKKAAKTTLGILNGRRQERYNETEKKVIAQAKDAYKKYAEHIYILEGMGDIGVKDISKAVDRHISITGREPLVFVDYLQALSPYDEKFYADKARVDKNVLELKRLSRRVPVFAISSFNRESYQDEVSLTSFKESGGIEYGADLLLGLQFEGVGYDAGEADKDHKKRVTKLTAEQRAKGRSGEAEQLELKILKNRNGDIGTVKLDFYPLFNMYRDRGNNYATQPDTDHTQKVYDTSALPYEQESLPITRFKK